MSSVGVSGLSGEQQYNLMRMLRKGIHHDESQEIMILDSPGGCGKTHVLRVACGLMDKTSIEYAVGTFTGRAASQVSKEGVKNVSTLHSLLLEPVLDDNGDLIRFTDRSPDEVASTIGQVLICDESSMIPSEMYKKLKKICDRFKIKFVLIGDSAQLEPIEPEQTKGFNSMDQSGEHLKLTHNFRHAAGSSVAGLAMHLREENSIPLKKAHDLRMTSKTAIKKLDFHQKNHFDVIICGMHKMRRQMNRLVRTARGYEGEIPEVGETVVCRRNDVLESLKINNGELYEVLAVYHSRVNDCHAFRLQCKDKNLTVIVNVPDESWTEDGKFGRKIAGHPVQSFQFGYALTCHSMQGSQADNIMYVDEDVSFFLDQQRFRYTAVSRAAKHLTVAR